MRTTVRLDPELAREAKQLAAATGRTLTSVIEDALREVVARRKGVASKSRRIRLPTGGSAKLRPGVDLDNSAELLDLMEAPDAAD